MNAANETIDLRLSATPEFVATLDRLAAESGVTPSEVLRMAVVLMDMALEAKRQGKQIGIAEKDQPLSTVITGF